MKPKRRAPQEKVKASFATFVINGQSKCDLTLLAETLKNWGNIPSFLNNTRAYEISLLAKAYLEHKEKRK